MKASESHWAVDQEKSPSHAIATYAVTTAVAGPRPVYRASFDFGFELPSPESTVSIAPASARFRGDFLTLQSDVAGSAISGTPATVTLDTPKTVKRVETSGVTGTLLQLFRVDVHQVAPAATVFANLTSGAAAFSGFVDSRFMVGVDGRLLNKSEISRIVVSGTPTGARLGLADPASSAPPTFFWTAPNGTETHADAGSAFAAALQAYLSAKQGDTSPSATLVIQCDQPCTFSLTAFDTGASFALDGFAFPSLVESDLVDPDALAAKIEAASDPVSAFLRSQLGSAALLDGLNAIVEGGPLYDAGRFGGVSLSAETQAALGAGDTARTNRLLLQDAFPDLVAAPSAKRVLRFPPDRAAQAGIAVSLPAGATITKAALSTQETLRGDRPENAGAETTASAHAGVHVSGDDSAAVSVTVAQALTATGLALPLLALASSTQVSVELVEDDQGAPSGKTLATATATLQTPGAAEWSTVYFDAVVLDSGPVWIALRAAKGEAVWIAAGASEGLHVIRIPDTGGPIETVLPELEPLYQLLSRSGSAADGAATTLKLGGATLAAQRDGDRSSYDLAAALQPHGAAGGTVALTFTSAAGGSITVYPPHVEYTL